MLRGAVPVDLPVKVVAVEDLRRRVEEVIGHSGQIRERNQRLNLLRDRVNLVGRDDVVGELRTAHAVNCAGSRVEDRSVGVGAEIAGALIGRRNREGILLGDALEGAFVAAEEEELLFLDRPAQGGAGNGIEILK